MDGIAKEDALDRAKKVLKDSTEDEKKVVYFIFPELKESEDERIRKAIFKALSKKDAREILEEQGIQISDALAWLEKQGEQKPAEWSEEDENWMNYFEKLLEFAYHNDVHVLGKNCVAGKMWLKSLKDRARPQWKPSEEQMDILKRIADGWSLSDSEKMNINILRNDLKKLRGE